MKRRNKSLFRMMWIMILLGTLVVANVLFVMFTKTHLYSGNSVLDTRIPSSIISTIVSAKRGTIYDRNQHAIAQDMKSYTLIANTRYFYGDDYREAEGLYVADVESTASQLASVLNIKPDAMKIILNEAIEKKQKETELGDGTKRISEDKKKEIEALKIPGINFIEDTSRIYPASPLASNLIGFATYNDEGKTFEGKLGLEKQLDSKLAGKNGEIKYQQSRFGKLIPGTTQIIENVKDGYDVNLTLDWNLQNMVETALSQAMEEELTEGAWCIVMEVETGKILAWANYPTFDQNTREDIPTYLNTLSQESYEPGSVMKPFTYAVAIDTGVYPTNKKFRSHQFWYKVEDDKIKRVEEGSLTPYMPIQDALDQDYGEISFEKGFALSSNVGICELLTNYVKYEDYVSYLNKFGFFKKVNMNYVKDIKGNTNLTKEFKPEIATDYLSSGFGQSSSVTPLQLVQAYSSIFNNGMMMKPYVVESIVDNNSGNVIESYKPEVVGTPISSKTSQDVRTLMKKVVEPEGSGERFAIEGIDMIAKTGTGEIYDTELQSYRTDLYNSSIIAAAPSKNPKILVYYGVKSGNLYYNPQPFKDIFLASLNYNTIDASKKNLNPESQNNPQWNSFILESLVNHSLDYGLKKLEGHPRIVVIGDGKHIVDQYPKGDTEITVNETVFLTTEGTHFTMPDMQGWTMKEVGVFWKMTGIYVEADGQGRVYNQNIEPGSVLTKEDVIKVYLS
ncbi:MAG: PASTA domain-containing protein [Firmicutes bacterium]|nr:PASTA domain-containing protein [Bacillota bacterium]